MSDHALIVEVHLLADRWHGSSGWPPSPFRLFQALVAGAYGGRWPSSDDRATVDDAFRWLESLAPPLVFAPRAKELRTVAYFVPNNDLDAVGNDPRRTAEIRKSTKLLKSSRLETDEPIAYLWYFDGSVTCAETIATVSERLHTFGRGLDAAFARARVTDGVAGSAYAAQRASHRSIPSGAEGGIGGTSLECPIRGSLASLHRRHALMTQRFSVSNDKKEKILFRQPPKAEFRLIAYERQPRRLVFDVREPTNQSFFPIRLEHATWLTTIVRDLAFERLAAVIEDLGTRERIILGRDGSNSDSSQRLRFVPLPSIGTRHTDASIRRIAVEIPPDCPFAFDDVRWAIAGRPVLINDVTAEVRAILVPSADNIMMKRYIGRGARRWQSVTPIVLPFVRTAARMSGRQRVAAEASASAAVANALRHAGVTARPVAIRVQREPLFERGASANDFEAGRFGTARLIHIEIQFSEPVVGPLIIGDGRWLGLGLMRPVWEHVDRASALEPAPDVEELETETIDDDDEADEDDE